MALRLKTGLRSAWSARSRCWQRTGFFRPIGEALEDRTLLAAAAAENDYAHVTPDWFTRLPSGLSSYSPQTLLGPLSVAVGNSGNSSQMSAEVAQWIIRLSPQATQEAVSVFGVEAVLNTETIAFDVLRGLGLPGQMLVEGGTATEVVRAALAGNPNVASFEPNAYVVAQALPNDPDFPTLTGLNNLGQFGATVDADIDAAEAWDENTGSATVVVGVIDSGIDYTHPDLYLNIWINPGEIPAALKTQLIDSDDDDRITFYDLNNAANSSRVSNLNSNTYIDAGDLFADPRWTDGIDTDRNSFVDDLVGWNFRSAVDEPFEPNDPRDVSKVECRFSVGTRTNLFDYFSNEEVILPAGSWLVGCTCSANLYQKSSGVWLARLAVADALAGSLNRRKQRQRRDNHREERGERKVAERPRLRVGLM